MKRAFALGVLAAQPLLGGALAAPPTGRVPDPSLTIVALDRRLADIAAEGESHKQELSRVGDQLALRHVRIVARGRAFYRLTRAGLLPVGGGFQALLSHAMHVERARRLLSSDVEDEIRLRGRAAELAREIEVLDRDRDALASQRASAAVARVAIQDEQRRQAAFDKAFETSTGAAAEYVPVYGGGGLDPVTTAGSFATARGRLLFPLAGRADVHPAHREGTEGLGLEIRAAVGTPVRAVFAGRIAFADRYGPYGRIVIVDHGDHYYTVSGDLDTIDVKIGQEVEAGDRIGTVGDDGQGAMLYFEVRHGSRTISPTPWLGL
ncbi:MAG: peptidoglycan DD-metalloendopeptidase family protein [Myxococcota bacterium]|nr:peptidoglycan DD-metalloendopeptidase family protein [Myxococcota bacterium]